MDIKKYAIKYVKMMQNQRRKSRQLSLVDAFHGQGDAQSEQEPEWSQADDDAETEQGLQEIFAMNLALPDQAAEINGFMQKRFNTQRSRSQPRGRPTQPGRFPPSRSASAPVRPPPRE